MHFHIWRSHDETVRKSSASPVEGHVEETGWYGQVQQFLQAHPKSSLLTVVEEILPDFPLLPPEARAHLWFWVKAELNTLAANGDLISDTDDDGITTWSLSRSGADCGSRFDKAKREDTMDSPQRQDLKSSHR